MAVMQGWTLSLWRERWLRAPRPRLLNVLFIRCLILMWGFSPARADEPASLIDTMVLYTPSARTGAGGTAAIRLQIAQAVREANEVFQNSGVHARIRLVHAGMTFYTESGSVSTDIIRLRNSSDRHMEHMHRLRNLFAADLVCLVTETGDDWLFYGIQGPAAKDAFSIVRRPHLTGNYFFPVALSFNFGCQTERAYADSEAAFPFAYGHTFLTDRGWFSTVEAFAAERLPIFSNPNIYIYNGRAGIPLHLPGPADNTSALNQTAPQVAAFRGRSIRSIPPHVSIVTPSEPTTAKRGEGLKFEAVASDPDGKIQQLDLFAGDQWIASAKGPRLTTWWKKPRVGTHRVVAVATDNTGVSTVSAAVGVEIRAAAANDKFANRQRIVGTNATVQASNWGATSEHDEPNHAEGRARHSLWWTWTAPADGLLWVDTSGSSNTTVAAIYRGNQLSNLRPVPRDDLGGGFRCRVSAGTVYQIAIDSLYHFAGNVSLHLVFGQRVANDDFENRQLLAGAHVQTEGSLEFGTVQAGEPAPYGVAKHSLWYSWTASEAGVLDLKLTGGDTWYQHVAALQGDSLTNLTVLPAILSSDEFGFRVEPGDSLQIVVNGQNTPGIDCDGCRFNLKLDFSPKPVNDDFADSLELAGARQIVTNSMRAATSEAGEGTVTDSLFGNSVWWHWVAPASGRIIISSTHSVFETFFHVRTGDSMLNSTLVAYGLPLAMDVVGGTRYSIAARGKAEQVVMKLLFSGLLLASPVNGSNFPAGSDIPIHVAATEFDAPLTRVEFFEGETLLGIATDVPFSMVWSNAPAGDHHLKAIAYDINGETHTLPAIEFAVNPTNDNVANAALLAGTGVYVEGTTRGATHEAGERAHSGPSLSGSVWYSWTAPNSGSMTVALDSEYPGSPGFAVYADSPSLNPVVSSHLWHGASFMALQGRKYLIAVDLVGYRSDFRLHISEPPPNDKFSDAMLIASTGVLITGRNTGATLESKENSHSQSGGQSVWWKWTAPVDGRLTVTSPVPFRRSEFPPTLRAFTGSSISALTPFLGDWNPWQQPAFAVTGGTTYAICADGRWEPEGIAFSLAFLPNPSNDLFIAAAALEGTNVITHGNSTLATLEPGEPDHFQFQTEPSLWYSWTAPGRGLVTLGATGTNAPNVAVYTGTHFGELNRFGRFSLNNHRFHTEAGIAYRFAVCGNPGEFELALQFFPAPPNDLFAARIPLGGFMATAQGNSRVSTREPGEPWPPYYAFDGTVWYSWVSPANGRARVTAAEHPIAVYMGSALSNLVSVTAANYDLVTFDALAGRQYEIAIGGGVYQPDFFELTVQFPKVQLVGPTNGAQFAYGSPIPMVAGTLDLHGTIRTVEFLDGSNVVATVAGPPFEFAYAHAAAGFRALRARATDENGLVTEGDAVEITVRPPNDDFAQRLTLSGSSITLSSSNQTATSEPLERLPLGALGNTVWWSWTAPASGQVTVTNTGFASGFFGLNHPLLSTFTAVSDFSVIIDVLLPESPEYGFSQGPVVAVYTGSELANLTLKGSNTVQHCASCEWRQFPSFTFDAVADATYFISVDGLNSSSGVTTVSLELDAEQAMYSGAPILLPLTLSLASATNLQTGHMVKLKGLSGTGPVVIYATTNLAEWDVVWSNSPPASQFEFHDPQSVGEAGRFYKAIQLQPGSHSNSLHRR
ncbi:MAG TPA: Ig-like domain-containing protein [Verrucomicrobiae bacterium]|nr:Ig-like domain-containing protein [Verrucomicrobiae bacterium]